MRKRGRERGRGEERKGVMVGGGAGGREGSEKYVSIREHT
jgi:hypothetical protein